MKLADQLGRTGLCGILCWLILATPVAQAIDTPGERGLWDYDHHWSASYTQWRDINRLSGGDKDPHVWVYTSGFAQRFGMPDRWIDDSLQGAVALAFRYDYDIRAVSCSYADGFESCHRVATCMMDVYVSEEVALPWNTDSTHENSYGLKSVSFLRPQNNADDLEYFQRRAARGDNSWPLGLDDVTIEFKKGGEFGKFTVREFERQLYSGIDFISGSLNCDFDALGKAGGVIFKVTQSRFASSSNAEPILNRGSKQAAALQFEIPASFLGRVNEYDLGFDYQGHGLERVRDSVAIKKAMDIEQKGVK